MDAKQFEDLIDRLGVASLEARSLITEIHGAKQDLQQELRKAREEIERLADEKVQEIVSKELASLIEKLATTYQEALSRATSKAMTEFDKVVLPLMAALDKIADEYGPRMGVEFPGRDMTNRRRQAGAKLGGFLKDMQKGSEEGSEDGN